MLRVAPTNVESGGSCLEGNLAALAISSPRASALIRDARPHGPERLGFVDTEQPGAPSAEFDGRALASRRRPLDEAAQLAETVDLRTTAVVVSIGFGLGHHVAALARRVKRDGLIVVFEPDLALLRAVFERVDHTPWLRESNVILLTDPDDAAAISSATRGAEGLLALGTRIIDHPASRARLGAEGARFGEAFARIVAAVRTVVVTTMVQSEVTTRNLLMNVEHYCRGSEGAAGVGDLAGLCAGRPAVVVSAGPSLKRNMHLLATPGLRERCVIIAVQTTLKSLLAIGVRPHFVTALDYHEISRRFYEGLEASDVEGVTLVAEPKANPAIFDAFPGAIRCCGDEMLDKAMGADLAGAHGALPAGATVAHLAYYLARHLGCDPVMLIGQDLGFTDGQYYAAGAAIHDVWAAELNSFNTLEMMEWQRIMRSRRTLRKATDQLGRPIYTDEQMATYLAQFERDFAADAARGLTIIDATEGGVAKAHSVSSTLAEALSRWAPEGAPALPATPAEAGPLGAKTRDRAEARLRELRAGVGRVAELSRRAGETLRRMIDRHGDHAAVNRLIGEVNALRDEVREIEPAYELVQRINQTGGFKRARADRMMRMEETLDPFERQRRQIERDRMNVRWLADAADSLAAMLDSAIAALRGAPKLTRDPAPQEGPDEPGAEGVGARAPARRVAALIAVEPERSTLGARRSLDEPFLGKSPLRATLERLARCSNLDGAILFAEDPARARALIGDGFKGLPVEIVPTDGPPLGLRAESMRAARLWADTCWRGGLCSFTCYDELLAPEPMSAALERLGFDAGLLVGAEWCLVDPGLCDAVIARHVEDPARRRITFTQAPPGLAGCVVALSLMRELGASLEKGGPFASIGGMLGYVPISPQADPIVAHVCVQTAPSVRDTLFRCVPDSDPRRTMLEQAMHILAPERGWPDVLEASAEQIAAAIVERQKEVPTGMPKQIVMELCAGRRTSGMRFGWLGPEAEAIDRPVMTLELAEKVLRAVGEQRTDAVVDFAGVGDPLLHPRFADFIRLAKECGIAGVHVRTDLLADDTTIDALVDSPVDIVSVDLMANTAETYRRIMGVDMYRRAVENVDRLLKRRATVAGLPKPWVVPRMTRCDAAYEEMEVFFDKWLLLAGSAVIDQMPRAVESERIRPLGKPNLAARRDWRSRLMVLSDGSVIMDERRIAHRRPIGNVATEPVNTVWRRLLETRRNTWRRHGFGHPDLWTGW